MRKWNATVLLSLALLTAVPVAVGLSYWGDHGRSGWDDDRYWGFGDSGSRDYRDRYRPSGDSLEIRLSDGRHVFVDENAYRLLVAMKGKNVTDQDVSAVAGKDFSYRAWRDPLLVRLGDGRTVSLSAGAFEVLRLLKGNAITDRDVLEARNLEYATNPSSRSVVTYGSGPGATVCYATWSGYECGSYYERGTYRASYHPGRYSSYSPWYDDIGYGRSRWWF